MRPLILAALLTAPLAAQAQQPPEMVLLPRVLGEQALLHLQAYYIQHPDDPAAQQIIATLQGCLADNPQGGRLTRQGQDACPAVTAALAARDKELADAKAAAAPAAPAKP